MPTFLQLRFTFLNPEPTFHGRADGGEPEWPPSPLRAYQSLVAAAAARFRGRMLVVAGDALRWLEQLSPPDILCPPGQHGQTTRLAVPDNELDLTAAYWSRKEQPPDKFQPHRMKAMKSVRPTHLLNGRGVRYVWKLADDQTPTDDVMNQLREVVAGVTHLGWGVDQAVADVSLHDTPIMVATATELWLPSGLSGHNLRVPQLGTLAELCGRYVAFQSRFGDDNRRFDTGTPPEVFLRIGYRNSAASADRPWVAFAIIDPDPDKRPPAFDPARRTRDVAAWVRHAVGKVCEGWPDDYGTVERFVHGHDGPGRPVKGDGADRRFQYLPLPTVERRGDRGEVVGAIRRALVTAPPGCERQVEWLRQRLSGSPLEGDKPGGGKGVVGLLNRLPDADWVRRQYTRASATWSTVTPVLLPGHDDRDRGKAERLIWQAFEDAGLAPEALAGASAEWRAVGYRPGLDPAWRYEPAAEAKHWPRYHVRVRFARPVAGPLAVGAGRYRGFGLFVAD